MSVRDLRGHATAVFSSETHVALLHGCGEPTADRLTCCSYKNINSREPAPMDRLLSVEAFVRVAETGTFANAAQQLGVTRSVFTHRTPQPAQFLNAPLFRRSTRHVRLSEVGETYSK